MTTAILGADRIGTIPLRAAAAFMVVLVSLCCHRAHGQVLWSDQLPEAISVEDLSLYRAWLNLSEAQWVATQTSFQSYLAQYAALRTDEIDPFLKQSYPPGAVADTIHVMTEAHRKRTAIRNKVVALDETLFVSISAVLDKTQMDPWERVRHHRARRIAFIKSFLKLTGKPYLDLSDLVRTMELNEGDRIIADVLMSDYERSLTSLVVQLQPLAETASQKYLEALFKRFGENANASKSEEREAAWNSVNGESIRIAARIDALNASAAKNLETILSPQGSARWREIYLCTVYDEPNILLQVRLRAAKAMESVPALQTAEGRALAAQLYEEYDRKVQALIPALVAIEDRVTERHGTQSSRFQQQKEASDAAVEAGAKLHDLNAELTRKLAEQFGPEVKQQFEVPYKALMKMGVSLYVAGKTVDPVHRSMALSRDQFAALLGLLQFDEEANKAAEEAFTTYSTAALQLNPEGNAQARDGTFMKRLHDFDQTLLDALRAIAKTPAQQQLIQSAAQARQRILNAYSWPPARGSAARVDWGEILLLRARSKESAPAIAEILTQYDQDTAAQSEELVQKVVAYNQLRFSEAGAEIHDQLRAADDAVTEAMQQLASANYAWLERVRKGLSDAEGLAVSEEFSHQAFPYVYSDQDAAHQVLRAAQALPGLPQEQAAKILEASSDYREHYSELTQKMVAAVADVLQWTVEEGAWRPICRNCAAEYVHLSLERRQLSLLVRQKLRTVLSADQAAQIRLDLAQ